jgi:hypothetical protein
MLEVFLAKQGDTLVDPDNQSMTLTVSQKCCVQRNCAHIVEAKAGCLRLGLRVD